VWLETATGLRHRFNFAETFVVPAAAEGYKLTSVTGDWVSVVECTIRSPQFWAPGTVPERRRTSRAPTGPLPNK
jgi:hypothetical protein